MAARALRAQALVRQLHELDVQTPRGQGIDPAQSLQRTCGNFARFTQYRDAGGAQLGTASSQIIDLERDMVAAQIVDVRCGLRGAVFGVVFEQFDVRDRWAAAAC